MVSAIALGLGQDHPLAVYLQEGFNGGGLPPGWAVTSVSGNTASWAVVGTGTNPPILPFAGAGQAKFNSYDAASGDQARLVSARVNLSSSTDPFISFFMYHDDEFLESLDSVYLEATTGDSITGPWTTLGGFRRPRTSVGWRHEVASLLQYNGASRMFIGFRGVSKYGNNIYIDEVRVADSSFHDIGPLFLQSSSRPMESASHPTHSSRVGGSTASQSKAPSASPGLMAVHLASPLNIGAVVQNFGTFAEPTYQVQWQIDGLSQTPINNTRTLQRGGRDTISLSWLTPVPGTHNVMAWSSMGSDSNRSNDTARIAIAVLDSTVFFAEMFNGATFPPPGWLTVDRDGGSLPPWFQGSAASIFLPYEGNGFAADNFQRGNGTYLDDYLISPQIPNVAPEGRVDSLNFWVRSAFSPPPAQNYPDSLMVLLSTSGTDTADFTTFVDYFSVPKTGWALKQYQLTGRIPDNSSVRIAFRYLHYAGGSSGANADFVGVDFVTVTRGLQVSAEGERNTSFAYSLEQNYPNPFNPSTTIPFTISHRAFVTVKVYDLLGREVATLVNTELRTGTYIIPFNATHLSSGVYLYVLRSGFFAETKRLVVMK